VDCNEGEVDVSFRSAADMTVRCGPEVDFFLRILGRCCNDGGGEVRDGSGSDDSDLDIVDETSLGLGWAWTLALLGQASLGLIGGRGRA